MGVARTPGIGSRATAKEYERPSSVAVAAPLVKSMAKCGETKAILRTGRFIGRRDLQQITIDNLR